MRRLFVLARITLTACLVTTMLLCCVAVSGTWATDSVIVNDVVIPSKQIWSLEKKYRIHIVNGNYWYDRISGAWGYRGGPAMGQIQPFLKLGGRLKTNASNGKTKVFINGRELHILDVRALQQITTVVPGRYWCDAKGNIGFDGGPALVNLWVLAYAASSRGVKREGILSSYDKTGAAVIGGEVLIKR